MKFDAAYLQRISHETGFDAVNLEKVLDEDIKRLFYPLLKADDRPTAAEMMAVVEPLLRGALDHKRENGYLDRMASGTYAPELLFPGHAEIAERIGQHPALVWKAKNVADHLASRRKPR